MKVQVGDRVKVITPKGFELPMVMEIRSNDDLVLKRRKKHGNLMIPMTRFHELDKSFRGAKYECIIKVRV